MGIFVTAAVSSIISNFVMKVTGIEDRINLLIDKEIEKLEKEDLNK